MKKLPSHRPVIGAGIGLLLGACQGQAPQPADTPLAVQVLHRGSNCGRERASLLVVPDRASLDRAVAPVGLLGAPAHSVAADFTRQAVFQLSMGQQPTAGAQINVTSASLNPATRQLTVNALWQPPDPGRMQAMVITQPCVVFSLPLGDYRSARVVDQAQQEKLTVDLTAVNPPK